MQATLHSLVQARRCLIPSFFVTSSALQSSSMSSVSLFMASLPPNLSVMVGTPRTARSPQSTIPPLHLPASFGLASSTPFSRERSPRHSSKLSSLITSSQSLSSLLLLIGCISLRLILHHSTLHHSASLHAFLCVRVSSLRCTPLVSPHSHTLSLLKTLTLTLSPF